MWMVRTAACLRAPPWLLLTAWGCSAVPTGNDRAGVHRGGRAARRGGPGGAARRRHGRRHQVVGGRTGGHRLAGRDRAARPRDPGLPQRQRPGRGPRNTDSAAGSIRGWPGAGSSTTRSGSTACRSCCSRRFSTSIPTTRIRRCAGSRASGSGSRSCRWAPGRPPRAGRSITSASVRTRPTTSTASRARPASGGRRCRSGSPSRTRARSSRSRRPRPRSTTGGCWRGASSATPACCSPRCAPPSTRTTGSATAPASAARAAWIACSSRARRATSAASWWTGR